MSKDNRFREDADENRCYAFYFGSIERAQEALDSLTDCVRCINCRDLVGCTDYINGKDAWK